MFGGALGNSGAAWPITWFTALVYMLAAALCLRAGFRDWRAARLWLAFSVLLILFGIAKPLQLQELITSIGRQWAIGDGWYAGRKDFQETLVFLVPFAAIMLVAFVQVLVRRQSPQLRTTAITFVLLCGFIGVRTTSFHDIDSLLYTPIFPAAPFSPRLSDLIELAAISFIALNAAAARPSRRSRRRFRAQVRNRPRA